MLNTGNSIIGNNATTGIGKASVTHQVIINAPTASTLQASGPTWKGFIKYINRAMVSPPSNEKNLNFCLYTVASRKIISIKNKGKQGMLQAAGKLRAARHYLLPIAHCQFIY